MIRRHRLLDMGRRHALSVIIAVRVEIADAASVGPMIFAGSVEPAAARRAMTVMGTTFREDVVTATNVHMASVAVPGSLFSSSSFSIALIPRE